MRWGNQTIKNVEGVKMSFFPLLTTIADGPKCNLTTQWRKLDVLNHSSKLPLTSIWRVTPLTKKNNNKNSSAEKMGDRSRASFCSYATWVHNWHVTVFYYKA